MPGYNPLHPLVLPGGAGFWCRQGVGSLGRTSGLEWRHTPGRPRQRQRELPRLLPRPLSEHITTQGACHVRSRARPARPLPSCLPELVVYERPHFAGQEWRTNLSWRDLGENWRGKVASVIVVSGTWAFFPKQDYQGARQDLEPGYYPEVEALGWPEAAVGSFAFVAGTESATAS